MGLRLSFLRKRAKSVERELEFYKSAIEKRETELRLPALRKKYEGKYFKYDNGYNSTDRWNVYVFCSKVTGLNECVVTRFETEINGENTFSINKTEHGFWILQQQINKVVYNNQFKKFASLIDNLT